MTARAMRGNVTVTISVLLAAVLAYFIYEFTKPGHPCLEALPRDQSVGIKVETLKGGLFNLDLKGQRGSKTGASPEQLEFLVKCIEAAKAGNIVSISDGVRLPLEPVGQVANRWQRESGVKLRLMPGGNDDILNNLRIGPATGLKENVIGHWCSNAQAGNCVTCEPNDPKADTTEVLVRLRANPPAEKQQLSSGWAVPTAKAPSEPWQLVDNKGTRHYYECTRPGS